MSTSDQDRAFLEALQARLWPKTREWREDPVKLTRAEWDQVKAIVSKEALLTDMFCSDMFGSIGMSVYDHAPYPGTPPTRLLDAAEANLPGEHKKRFPGSNSDFAWEEFSQFTHSERNKGWLKMYNMRAPRSRGDYDY